MPTSIKCATLCSSLLLGCSLYAAADAARPNIVWVVNEDSTYNFVGPYGDPLARTPNIDALAKDGIVFDHVYTQPVCAPSRNTIITGRYASSMGTQHMRSLRPLPEGVRFFPQLLRAAGYFCTNNGKTDYNTSYTGDASPYDANNPVQFHVISDPRDYHAIWDENSQSAHWRHRKSGQPFFSVFNFMQSHESQLQTRQPLQTDPRRVRVPAYLPDTAVVRADLAQYYDCVSRADQAIGRVLDELQRDGLAEDTIVFYFSDNGGVVTGPKRFLNDQGTHVAFVARFPKKFAHLAPAAAGTHTGELLNFVDLAPTMLSLAGLPADPQFQGRAFAGADRKPAPAYTFVFADRMDERYNLVRAATDGKYRYIRNYYPNRPWGQHLDYLWKMATIQEWQLHFTSNSLRPEQRQFFESQPPEALYDCEADPDNVHNLARLPEMAGRVAAMRNALNAHLLTTRDTGFLPEPMMVTQADGRSPTVVTSDENHYPLTRILALLDAVQLDTPKLASQLVRAAAAAPEPVLRYWAACSAERGGCVDLSATLLSDGDPVVRVAAAEAELVRGASTSAMDVMEHEIATASPVELRLFALDALARVPRGVTPSLARRLGELASSADLAGYDYMLSRVARYILREYQDAPRANAANKP